MTTYIKGVNSIEMKKEINISQEVTSAVSTIRSAILLSQERAVKAINQEQLALYYGIGRFISANTRNKNWGKGVIEGISNKLKQELPGIKGYSVSSLKNMRLFFEAWNELEINSPIAIGELNHDTLKNDGDSLQTIDVENNTIRQLQLANYPNFPIVEFLSISFTHHIRIIENAKDIDERMFYIRYCHNYKPTTEEVPNIIKKQDLYHHQGALPNNFVTSMPDYKQAFRAIQMFKDEYLLDFINVEQLGMRDEEIDERVIEQNIVYNVKNFIMTFGKGFTFVGNQIHFDKFGHDHLNDDDRREGEFPPVGIILCKDMDKEYVNYIMQDYLQPMGVATYKTADEIAPDIIKYLPPKEELMKLIENGHEGARGEEPLIRKNDNIKE